MDDNKTQIPNPKNQISNGVPVGVTPGGKETEPVKVEVKKPTETKIEVIPDNPETDKETEKYIEKVEKQAELQTPVIDDYTGQVLMAPTNTKPDVVTLPLTEEQVVRGLHMQVYDGLRWMAEWCVRQIKLLHGKVRYKS